MESTWRVHGEYTERHERHRVFQNEPSGIEPLLTSEVRHARKEVAPDEGAFETNHESVVSNLFLDLLAFQGCL